MAASKSKGGNKRRHLIFQFQTKFHIVSMNGPSFLAPPLPYVQLSGAPGLSKKPFHVPCLWKYFLTQTVVPLTLMVGVFHIFKQVSRGMPSLSYFQYYYAIFIILFISCSLLALAIPSNTLKDVMLLVSVMAVFLSGVLILISLMLCMLEGAFFVGFPAWHFLAQILL